MSGLPFMQLYPAQYLQDTRHLNCEAHGAYLLLLMDLWVGGGTLPNDDAELAERVKLTKARWKTIRPKLARFFVVSDDGLTISNKRITADLEKARAKSAVRAEAGASGGKAKAAAAAGKDVANANPTPEIASAGLQHLKDEREDTERAAQLSASAIPEKQFLLDKALAAAGLSETRLERAPGLVAIGPLVTLLSRGYDLETDVLAAIAWKHANSPAFKPKSWSLYLEIVPEFVAQREAVPQRQAPPVEGWADRLKAWRLSNGEVWGQWGPRPGEPGCRVPADLLTESERKAAA